MGPGAGLGGLTIRNDLGLGDGILEDMVIRSVCVALLRCWCRDDLSESLGQFCRVVRLEFLVLLTAWEVVESRKKPVLEHISGSPTSI